MASAKQRLLEFDDIYRFRLPSDPQLSPDGARVAFVISTSDREADENRSTVWLVDVDGQTDPRQLTRGPSDGAPRWSPDGLNLVFVAGGTELRVLPLAGGESRVIATAAGVSEPAWSPDGTRIAYGAIAAAEADPHAPVVTRRLGFKADGAGLLGERRRHLFVVDVAPDAEPAQLTEGEFSVGAGPVWSPDGARIAWTASVDPDPDIDSVVSVLVSDTSGGAPKRITEPPAVLSSVAWMPDGASLIVAGAERQGTGHTKLYRVAADGGVLEPLAPSFDRNVMVGGPGYPGATPRVVDGGTHVLFCARDRGCTHIYTVAVAGGEPLKIVGDDELSVSGVASTDVFIASTPATHGEVYVRNTRLTNLSPADIRIVAPASREFTAPDGTTIHGWVARDNTATTPGPVLLDIHGGPHNAWNAMFDAVHLYHQTLVAQGWTILFINPRGSDGYGESFFNAVVGGWGSADTDDFLCAVDALVDEGIADAARVAVTGYSYGGYMTCWLTARTDRFAAAIAGGCVSDLMSESGSADMGHYLGQYEIGGLVGAEPRLTELSPITYVDAVTAPTLVLHGGADDRCPVGQAEEWFSALRVRRVETEFVRYPGASHLFILSGRPSHRIDYCKRVAEWAIEHTKGDS